MEPRSPEKRAARSEEKQTSLPATVRMVQDAAAQQHANGDSELQIHGLEPGVVILVGVVEGLVKQTASIEFVLNDTTGRIAVKYYITGECDSGLDSLAAGQYVNVAGSIRTSPAVHISVLGMRPITSADEVSFHMIESAHAALKLRKALSSQDPATPMPKKSPTAIVENSSADPLTPQKSVQPDVFVPAVEAVKAASPVDLRARLVDTLRREAEGKEEGVKLDHMVQRLQPATAADVRQILEQLVEEGDAYNTIDNEHFACV